MEKPKICKLCVNVTSAEHFIEIDYTSQEFAYALSFHLNLDVPDNNLICTPCFTKLLAAYRFKTKCIDVNNRIKAHVDVGLCEADLRQVILEGLSSQEPVSIPDEKKICYLCLEMINGKYRRIYEVDACWFQICIPEVNLTLSMNSVVCSVCLHALELHSKFVQSSLEVEEEIKCISNVENKNEIQAPLLDVYIKEEAIDLKPEEIEVYWSADIKRQEEEMERIKEERSLEYPYTEEEMKIRIYPCISCPFRAVTTHDLEEHFAIHAGSSSKKDPTGKVNPENHMDQSEDKCANCNTIYKCVVCSFETNDESCFKQHQLIHTGEPEITMKCESCSPQTKQKKGDLEQHQPVPKYVSKVTLYKCQFCSYQTKFKDFHKRHELKHTNETDDTVHQCEYCSYQTKHKANLNRHQAFLHAEKSELPWYNCESCSFQTNDQENLDLHKLTHKDDSEGTVYKCGSCSYQTRRLLNLKRHRRLHPEESSATTYSCDFCFFQTIHKSLLERHELKHEAGSQVKEERPQSSSFKCEYCAFETKYKDSLKKHQIVHKDEIRFKCEFCDFQTKYSRSLKHHQLTHKDESEVEIYKCEFCSYRSKRKSGLKRHTIVHLDDSEIPWHKCELCSYKSKDKRSIKKHATSHALK